MSLIKTVIIIKSQGTSIELAAVLGSWGECSELSSIKSILYAANNVKKP